MSTYTSKQTNMPIGSKPVRIFHENIEINMEITSQVRACTVMFILLDMYND